MPTPICLRLLVQDIARALSRALDKAGGSIAAKIAMIAITTSSSIRVNEKIALFCLSCHTSSCLSSLVCLPRLSSSPVSRIFFMRLICLLLMLVSWAVFRVFNSLSLYHGIYFVH